MSRNKLIVFVAIIFTISLTSNFSHAEQEKTQRTIFLNREIRIHKYNFRMLNNQRYSPHISGGASVQRDDEWEWGPAIPEYPMEINYTLPKKIYQSHVPGEILVKFIEPFSKFEMANLVKEFQPEDIEDLHARWKIEKLPNNVYRIIFPEGRSVEQMIQTFERNPLVEHAEPNYVVRLLSTVHERENFIPVNIDSLENKHIEKVLGMGVLDGSESTASNEAVKKDNEKPMMSEIDNSISAIQSFDIKSEIRSKAKIHAYRDKQGRIVITNYRRYKKETITKNSLDSYP